MFVLRYVRISLLISSLAQYLLKGVFLNFQAFVNFPVFLLLLISSFIPLWLGNILGIILVFWNLLSWFVTWHLIYHRQCSLYTWEEWILCCCWIECSVYICYGHLLYSLFKSAVSLLIFCLDDLWLNVGYWSLLLLLYWCLFLPSVISVLVLYIQVLWCWVYIYL